MEREGVIMAGQFPEDEFKAFSSKIENEGYGPPHRLECARWGYERGKADAETLIGQLEAKLSEIESTESCNNCKWCAACGYGVSIPMDKAFEALKLIEAWRSTNSSK